MIKICKTCGIEPVRSIKSRGKLYLGSECNKCTHKKSKRYTGEGRGGKMKLPEYKKMVSEREMGSNNCNYGKPSPSRGKPCLKNAGENNWNWKGGINKNTRLKNIGWVMDIYHKDDFICQKCGRRGDKLNAHHIYSYKDYPTLRNDLHNGITLCIKCHKEYHKIFGINSYDIQPFILFLWLQNIFKRTA